MSEKYKKGIESFFKKNEEKKSHKNNKTML